MDGLLLYAFKVSEGLYKPFLIIHLFLTGMTISWENIVFLFFFLVTAYFIWSSKISYGKRTLVRIGKAFIGVFIAIIALGFVLKALAAIIPGFTRDAAGDLMEELGVSLLFVWGMRYILVALCNMFGTIMDFHKKYNADNYRKFSPITSKLAPWLFIFLKIILTFGSIVIYYGIWLAN